MPRFYDCEQGSAQWKEMRSGHATASRFTDIMAGKSSRAYESYLWQLVAERIAGGPVRDSSAASLEWGTQAEPLARVEYQARTGDLVRQVGLALHDTIKWLAASSDGLVGDDGSVEIKSPYNSGIHARTLAQGMPEDHYWQCLGNIWILKRKWLDFCSFDPSFPKPHDLYIHRVDRVETSIKHLEKEVKTFLSEVTVATRDILSSQK